MGLACGLQDQRLMARPPARAGGRSGLLTGGESGNPNGYSLPFSQRVPSHIPSPPSRWAGRYGPFAVRAAGRVSCKKYGLPPHNPTREGGSGGGTSSPGGSFPHFFPRNGAPAGQAKVPCRSNGWEAPTGTRVPTPGRLIFQGNKKVPAAYAAGTHVAVYLITSAQP